MNSAQTLEDFSVPTQLHNKDWFQSSSAPGEDVPLLRSREPKPASQPGRHRWVLPLPLSYHPHSKVPPYPGSTCAQQPHRSGWIQTMVPGTADSRDSAQGAEPQSRAFLDFLVLLRGRIHFWGLIKSEKPEDVHWNSINMPEPKCLLFAETRRVSEAFFMWL